MTATLPPRRGRVELDAGRLELALELGRLARGRALPVDVAPALRLLETYAASRAHAEACALELLADLEARGHDPAAMLEAMRRREARR